MMIPLFERIWTWSVALSAILTALCPLYFALDFMRLYAHAGQSTMAILSIGEGGLLACVAYCVAAVLYVAAPGLRLLLAGAAIVLAGVAAARVGSYLGFLQNENMFTNLLAEPLWETRSLAVGRNL